MRSKMGQLLSLLYYMFMTFTPFKTLLTSEVVEAAVKVQKAQNMEYAIIFS